MEAVTLWRELATTPDEHRWADLPGLLHPEFRCTLVHTGEVFGRDDWVAFNAGYPGFQRMIVEEAIGAGDRAAVRARITGLGEDGAEQVFGLASFLTERDGVIGELTEVWTDIGATPPPGTRGT